MPLLTLPMLLHRITSANHYLLITTYIYIIFRSPSTMVPKAAYIKFSGNSDIGQMDIASGSAMYLNHVTSNHTSGHLWLVWCYGAPEPVVLHSPWKVWIDAFFSTKTLKLLSLSLNVCWDAHSELPHKNINSIVEMQTFKFDCKFDIPSFTHHSLVLAVLLLHGKTERAHQRKEDAFLLSAKLLLLLFSIPWMGMSFSTEYFLWSAKTFVKLRLSIQF